MIPDDEDEIDWIEATLLADRVIAESEELMTFGPDKAQDFAESVYEKAEGIKLTIEDRQHCTFKQQDALHNMLDGLAKWDY